MELFNLQNKREKIITNISKMSTVKYDRLKVIFSNIKFAKIVTYVQLQSREEMMKVLDPNFNVPLPKEYKDKKVAIKTTRMNVIMGQIKFVEDKPVIQDKKEICIFIRNVNCEIQGKSEKFEYQIVYVYVPEKEGA